MLTENQKKWVEALRSGKYKQAKGTLQEGNGFCCLGVACQVAKENGVYVNSHFGELTGSTLLEQQAVADWLGLNSSNGQFMLSEDYETLGNLKFLTVFNDRGVSFNDIADLIESKPFGLFKEE